MLAGLALLCAAQEREYFVDLVRPGEQLACSCGQWLEFRLPQSLFPGWERAPVPVPVPVPFAIGLDCAMDEPERNAYVSTYPAMMNSVDRELREVRAREAHYRAIFEAATDPILTSDERGIILAANTATERVFGYTAAELTGQSIGVLMPSTDRERHSEYISRYLRTGERKVIGTGREVTARRKDGTEFPVRLAVSETFVEGRRLFIGQIEDLSATHAAQEELRKSQDYLRRFIEGVPVGFVRWFVNGDILEANDYFLAMLGYTREELQAAKIKWPALTPPEYVPCDQRALKQLAEHGHCQPYEKEYIAKDGRRVPVLICGVMLDGGNLGGGAFILNLEDRKKIERDLELGRNTLEQILNSVPQTVFWKDRNGVYLGCNQAFAASAGFQTPAEVIGKGEFELPWPQEQAQFWLAEDREVMENNRPKIHRIEQLRALDGTVFWADTTKVPLLDDAGRVQGVVGVYEDVTERLKAELALQQSQKQLKLEFERMPIGCIVWDTEFRVQSWNPAAARIFGFAEEEVLGKAAAELIVPPDAQADVADLWSRLIVGDMKANSTNRNVTRTGEHIWCQWTNTPLKDDSGKVLGVISMVEDMTARKLAEEALLKAKTEAETANQAKDQFIAVLSHELRTPLTPILLSVGTLEARQDLPCEVRDELEEIRRNLDLETRLIDDLLDVTRISRGAITLNQEVVDAHFYLRAAMRICEGEVEAKHLRVALRLDAPQAYVRFDPARLQQVFWNLLRNAVKFTPEGGEISLQTENQGDRLCISFIDRGVGIAPCDLARIFNTFEQGERGKVRRFGGLGLGLSISRALVALHGGTLSAYSEGTGKGATFVIELATVPEPAQSAVRAGPVLTAKGGSERILLVEDNAATLRLLSRMLSKRGYQVTTASTVAAAIEAARNERFDLLISDLGLPDGTGLDVMREIRNLCKYEIPGIAISGYGTEEDIRQSRSAGFSEHLVKPVNFDAIRAAVRHVLHR